MYLTRQRVTEFQMYKKASHEETVSAETTIISYTAGGDYEIAPEFLVIFLLKTFIGTELTVSITRFL